MKPCFSFMTYNKASDSIKNNLDKTCDFFEIKSDRKFLCEILLRLDQKLSNSKTIPFPTDEKGKVLFKIYKHFSSLTNRFTSD